MGLVLHRIPCRHVDVSAPRNDLSNDRPDRPRVEVTMYDVDLAALLKELSKLAPDGELAQLAKGVR